MRGPLISRRAPMNRLCLALILAVLCAGCPKKPAPPASNRCEFALADSGLFATTGDGASARIIAGPSELIGGEAATGAPGDVLLQNDQLRVVIQKPGRNVGPLPFGGALIDADRQRTAGQPGHDQLGK